MHPSNQINDNEKENRYVHRAVVHSDRSSVEHKGALGDDPFDKLRLCHSGIYSLLNFRACFSLELDILTDQVQDRGIHDGATSAGMLHHIGWREFCNAVVL